MSDVTLILTKIEQGDLAAAEELLPLVYDELRKLAAAKLAQEKPGQTLQATALVHEAYVRLVGDQRSEVGGQKSGEDQPSSDFRPLNSSPSYSSRTHFFRAAAEAMRRVLVDSARRKQSVKHGESRQREAVEDLAEPASLPLEDILAVSEALEKLTAHDAQKAELVKLRYFAGLTLEEAAAAIGISRATAVRHWDYAKTWLYCELTRASKSS